MPVNISVTVEAQQDIGEGYDWYESRRIGLGEEFLGAVVATIQDLCRTPMMPAKIFKEYRRVMVRRFLTQ